MGAVLQARTGRCGEYAQLLFQLAQALGWRARLVVDWTDHMWVEVLVPDKTLDRNGAHGAQGDPSGGRGAHGAQRAAAPLTDEQVTPEPVATRAYAAASATGRGALPNGDGTAEAPSARRVGGLERARHRSAGKRAVRRRRQADGAHRWVAMDPCEATVDEPLIYSRDWGKTLTYVVAIGDGTLQDVTATYAHDWNATLAARRLSPEQVDRVLAWVRRVPRPW